MKFIIETKQPESDVTDYVKKATNYLQKRYKNEDNFSMRFGTFCLDFALENGCRAIVNDTAEVSVMLKFTVPKGSR